VTALLRTAREEGSAALVAALARVALVPLLLASEALESTHAVADLSLAEPVLAAYALFALASLALVAGAPRRVAAGPLAVADVLLLVVLLVEEGGATADVRFALSAPVLVAAFVAGPRLTAVLAALSVTGFFAAALASPTFGAQAPLEYVAVHTLDVAWRAALAVTLSAFLTRRSARIRELAESRRSLVAQALEAEARARRELAYVLHDEFVQGLLSARQDLKVVRRGRPEYLDRADAALADVVGRLRAEIFRLHPHQLEAAGLGAALSAVAEGLELVDGTRPVVAVTAAAADAPADEALVFAIGRELLTNAARHARAHTVALTVDATPEGLVVCCLDDGRGMAPGRRSEALGQGHLGLAAVNERVVAVGGRLDLRTAPGQGTQVRAVLPVAPSTEPGPTDRPHQVPGTVARRTGGVVPA
jgi:two-component system, NarL family, sensor kinase